MLITIASLLIVASMPLSAEVPHCINYQGCLTDPAGDPVADGIYNINFNIYGSAAGTDLLWSSGAKAIQVTGGMFDYMLGSSTSFPDDLWVGDTTRYLGITVGADPEIFPRTKLTSTAFAHRAAFSDALILPADLETADDFNPAFRVRNIGDGGAVYGICSGGYAGYFDGDGRFTGDLTIDGTLNYPGLGDITAVTAGSGLDGGGTSGDVQLYVASGGITSGHIQNNSITDNDINASANIAPTKINGTAAVLNGVNTFNNSNFFNGEITINDTEIGFRRSGMHRWRLKEESTGGFEFFQVYDDGGTLHNRTVMEIGDDNTVGIGEVIFNRKLQITWDINSTGSWYGQAIEITNQDAGNLYGIYSSAQHTIAGVAGNCYAVYAFARSDGAERCGVSGYCEAQNYNITTGETYGLRGTAWDGATAYGIYASGGSATTNWAAYFSGNCRVTGTFDNSKSTMRIDHPSDPENKVLEHATINSPEMLNVYSGNVTTNANGEAAVQLPDYFESLNKDFRYQLTVIGSFAQAIIKEKISNNQFVIATSEPDIEVSWQVTGVRNDAFAQSHPVTVEAEKTAEEKGYYINPEAFGFDITRSTEYSTNAEFRREIDERKERE
jgi:hypothetical protein